MADVVISEFLDEDAVVRLSASTSTFSTIQTLVNRTEELYERLQDCRGLIVRNRTQVRPATARLSAEADHRRPSRCGARQHRYGGLRKPQREGTTGARDA